MTSLSPLAAVRQFVCPQALPAAAGDHRIVAQIRELAERLRERNDGWLSQRTTALRAELSSGGNRLADSVLVESFALTVEAARRTLGVELYDVQLLAGLTMARGGVAEMQTGEGKTFATALPALLYSLASQGVHVITPNRYLAQRDCEQLRPLYELLSVSVGLVHEQIPDHLKAAAYACDITYGAGYEFGFDYLRDQLARMARPKLPLGQRYRDQLLGRQQPAVQQRQHGHVLAVIDEIDSVLIDEACTPLVLSEASRDDAGPGAFTAAESLAGELVPGEHFTIDPLVRKVMLTAAGVERIHADQATLASLPLQRPWSVYVEHALQARHLLRKDIDYVVDGGKVLLVDEFTGRIFADRTWRDGLHQAVETHAGVAITPPQGTAAKLTRQRYFRMYERLCGLTGTARGSERELWNEYRLPVTIVPPRLPCQRSEMPTRHFATLDAKWLAVCADVERLHSLGRPVLIGSRTIENSRALAARLQQRGVPHRVLNGTQQEDEAAIVAQAGRREAVTIATNMAGRGTDIKLQAGVADLGGLHLIGVERHASRRIDRQLIGRVARQGNPGSYQFFVSAEDSLITTFAPDLAREMRDRADERGEVHHDFSRRIDLIQRQAEQQSYTARRQLAVYDGWLDEVLQRLAKDR